MGYTVDLQGSDLRCRTKADAEAATEVVRQHVLMCPYHLKVSPMSMSHPEREDSWSLDIDYFAGDCWNNEEAEVLWVALAPHMAEDATIEFQGEDFYRWRIRWSADGVVDEYVDEVRWAANKILSPPLKGVPS